MNNSVALSIERPAELNQYDRWNTEITAAKEERKKFVERATKCTRKFLDERDAVMDTQHWFNIYYANTQILESALYAQIPQVTVTRKHQDYTDDVARVAALLLQRATAEDLDDPTDTFDATMRACVQDRLVPGLAQAWLRLETTTAPLTPPPMPVGEADKADPAATPQEQIVAQKVHVDYIYWDDFFWSPCRVWDERRWVGRRVYMDRDALVQRFGEQKGNAVPLNYTVGPRKDTSVQAVTPTTDALRKAEVFEIWDRTDRKVIWISPGFNELLDTRNDFLKLKGFDPCPRPMLANITTSNTMPRPDYYMLQDQYTELNTVNQRISKLVEACKVVGVFDKSAPGLQRLFKEGFDNDLIPVDNWAMFAEKGGIKGTVDWVPLETIVQALIQLNTAREGIKGQIYELTGIADIVRGASKASETLGAQQIKAQFASVRIKKLQDEVARFASEIMRLKAEIIAKHFAPEQILKHANAAALQESDEHMLGALQMLKTGEFEWRVTVNADTLSQADYAAEKQDRTEFLGMFAKFMQQFVPMIQAAPNTSTLLFSMLKWTVAGFRNTQELEGMLDKELNMLEAASRKPKPPAPPPPEVQKIQLEMAQSKQEHALDMAAKQQEMHFERLQQQLDTQRKQMELVFERQMQMLELLFERLHNQEQLRSQEALNDERIAAARAQASIKAKSSNASSNTND